jgi:ribosomal-protein-serine acetyltransferase
VLICSINAEIELRLIERQHVDAVDSLSPGDLSCSQGEWGEWTSFEGGTAEWVRAVLVELGRGTRLEAGIFRQQTLLGVVALHNIDRRRGSASIDYCMDSRYRNEGIMTQACRALAGYTFAELGLHRLQIYADTANLPSIRVPEKLRFTKAGVLRSHYRSASGFRDCALYSMLKDEWDRRRVT